VTEDDHPLHSAPHTRMSSASIDSSIVSLAQARQLLLANLDLAPEAHQLLEELQTQDALISDEIMDEITSASLPTLPTSPTPLPDVIIIEEKDYQPTILAAPSRATPPSQDLPFTSGADVTISPRSALSALSIPGISHAKTIEIAITLANTVQENCKDFACQTELYAQAIDRLQDEVCSPPGPPKEPPYGYILNDDIAPYFTITNKEGCLHMAPFVCTCPGQPTHILGTLGEPGDDEEYLCPIYAAPRHLDGWSLSALPPWFIKLLSQESPHTDTLIQATYDQSDRGLAADLYRYSGAGRKLHKLYREKDRIASTIQAIYEEQEYAHHRLERAQAPARLNHFCSYIDNSANAPFRANISNDNNNWCPPLPVPHCKHKHGQGQPHF
jgi:hypothetical protein